MEAMESAHIYHDAVRHGDLRASRSMLLSPNTQEAPELTAEDYIDRNGVGVMPLVNADDADSVVEFAMNTVIND
ncbi:MAG: hypothetical protein ACI9ZT_002112 [Gammaproteobacteria bacterium]|jgi:hypothetical protein